MTSGVWAAPGRLNLIGEHTDYNDGFVLPFALPFTARVTARITPQRRWSVASAQEPTPVEFGPADLIPGRVTGWAAYVAGVIWALTQAGYELPGAVLAIDSDVPLGAGLSSSAAIECAVLSAMCDLAGLDLPVPDRPRLAQRAENEYVGMPCGIMDQTASIRCQAGYALFLDCRSLAVEQVPCDPPAAGLAILVLDTRARHRHVDNAYADRAHACRDAAKLLGLAALRDIDDLDAALAALADPVLRMRTRHVVTENRRVGDTVALLRAGRLREIGPLLSASHASMRDDYQITVPEVDLAVEVALAHGAHGARMTGGGFGGCVLALVEAGATQAVTAAVDAAFRQRGYPPPTAFVGYPSAGATRLA